MEFPNWFALYADGYFERHLRPLAGRNGLRFLQIGAYTGDASVWLLDEILTYGRSALVDVDTWEGSDEPAHDEIDFTAVEALYDKRVAGRTVKRKMTSHSYFTGRTPGLFDFVYVDGDHTAPGVLSDAVLAWPLLREGGLMAFDDYLWTPYEGAPRTETPELAIDAFVACHAGQMEVLDRGQQVWVRKKEAA